MSKPKAVSVKWLDRSWIVGPYLTLVTSEEQFHVACDDLGIPMPDRPRWILNPHSDATVHSMTNKDGRDCHVVAMRYRDGLTGIEVAGLLIHEAVHIFQNFCDSIGERNPSVEFEAYSIQAIAQTLLQAYADMQP